MTVVQGVGRFDARERRLLGILVACFLVMVVVFIPFWVESLLAETRGRIEQLTEVTGEIVSSQVALTKSEAQRKAVSQRYARPAPPLGAYVDGLARNLDVAVAENQDQSVVPHGKRVDERSTRMSLRRTGLGSLARLLEKVAQSGHPIVVSKLNVRKRLSEPDSFDVDVVFSAYDRKEAPKTTGAAAEAPVAAAASASAGTTVAADEDQEVPSETGEPTEEQQ
jgi:general secretion pathway protein M